MKDPKLRTVEKIKPPYPLGKFPKEFAFLIGKEIVYKLATQPDLNLEGPEWERIFALAINAQWKPSNVGLDDIVKDVCAWGAKTVKNTNPFTAKSIRLISGRNSPVYSYDERDLGSNPNKIGRMALEIWNKRIESLRNKFSHLRTVVLIKSSSVTEFTVFEIETVMYNFDDYEWRRNKRGNLEGHDKRAGIHKFTWQPHGSQFTIIENVPETKLCFKIKKPSKLNEDSVLKSLGFNKNWIQIIKS